MIKMYISSNKELVETDTITEGVWINMVNPYLKEVNEVAKALDIDPDFINAALDEEERSRIEIDEEKNSVLILVDTPCISKDRESNIYETLPIGIIFTDKAIITVSLNETLVLEPFIKNRVKTFFTYKRSRFVLQILYKNASLYLYFLKRIDKQSNIIENELHKSLKNKELIQLLTLEKSLVYFSTSLKSNELVMEKLLRYDFIKKYEEDKELLEDTIIENKQAIEMSKIYSDILAGTMDAFASIISNNLNIVMKVLTSITIIMAIPTIISSFFGMNVPVPFSDNPLAFLWIILGSIGICLLVGKIMSKKDMF
ncbi:magnesium transporter CorA family protein [uncultured Tyzzerella sp.]|uniref:magnesium transporter CorA family protein n=1 Tax=uncultured Tyzzerella sp. TaxID=2321398 RepID=UPI002943ECA2|nr:magnesium transporter CorA family protein [uncultured Tyzzerella sp.]